VAHQPLYNIVSENILGRIGHNDALHTANYGGAFVIYVFLPVVVIGGLSVLGALVRKQAPLVHRLLTGGR
jgi:hypothetical protein